MQKAINTNTNIDCTSTVADGYQVLRSKAGAKQEEIISFEKRLELLVNPEDPNKLYQSFYKIGQGYLDYLSFIDSTIIVKHQSMQCNAMHTQIHIHIQICI